jgi:hypothetical protein
MRIRAAAIGVSLLSFGRAALAAAPAEPPDEYADVTADAVDPLPSARGFHLDAPSNFGFGLEGYAGVAAAFNSGPDRAHALVGGLARFRFHYFQLGGTFEITDSGEDKALGEDPLEHWRAVGGFAGVLLPFEHWITLDASVGLGMRTYANSLAIYGDNGLSSSLTSLTFRLAVSDRMTHRLIGPRLGAALMVSTDLSSVDVPWTRRYVAADGTVSQTSGTTPIGGTSIALVVTAGFELGGRPP